MEQDQTSTFENEVREVLKNDDIPHMYFNGFTTMLGTGDACIVLKLHDRPLTVLHLSYTLAKTLAEKLGATITKLEQDSGRSIMTTDDVKELIKKDRGEQADE